VVRRALLLNGSEPRLRQLLAPAYAMGFIHAQRRRKLTSLGLITGIFALVALVKRLPYPYRAILDAGVCTGLTWGICSTVAIFLQAWSSGRAPEADPCLPDP